MTPKKLKGIKIAWTVLGIVAVVVWILFDFIGWDFTSNGLSNAAKDLVYFLPEIALFLVFTLLWFFLSGKHPQANTAFIIILSVLSAWHLLETLVFTLWMSADGFSALSLLPGFIFLEFAAWVVLLGIINKNFRRSYRQ